MRLRTDDEAFRLNAVWLGPTGYTFPWTARYTAYGVGFLIFCAILLVKAVTPLSIGLPPVWEFVIAVLLTNALMALVDHDRPIRSVVQTARAEARASRPSKPARTAVVVRVRVEETRS